MAADLTATSWTVVITSRVKMGQRWVVTGTMALADTNEYPTGGIPMPAKGLFGFEHVMDAFVIFGNNAKTTDYLYRYDKANHKLFVYEEEGTAAGGPLLEADNAEVPGARTLDFVAIGL